MHLIPLCRFPRAAWGWLFLALPFAEPGRAQVSLFDSAGVRPIGGATCYHYARYTAQ